MPTRREFLATLAVRTDPDPGWQVRALTRGSRHHFFGYYGISPWNAKGDKLVCLESGFQDRLPRPEDEARIVLADAGSGALTAVTTTRAWNFQQGAMLHWNPLKPDSEVLFNERDGNRIVSGAVDVSSGKRRALPRAINGLSRNGRWALCLEYGRLTRLRPVVGYTGAVDPNPRDPHPRNDGVFVMDLATGHARLAVSIAEIYDRLRGAHSLLDGRPMWFNHTVFNPSASRFFFLARVWTDERRLESAMFTCAREGASLQQVIPFGFGVSHFEWRNDREILATCRVGGKMRHVLATDGQDGMKTVMPEHLDFDGHCSYAPGGRWMVTDRNDGGRLEKELLLCDTAASRIFRLRSFPMYEKQFLGGDLRCDLHPRWNGAGDQICVDALAEDRTRQLFLARLNRKLAG